MLRFLSILILGSLFSFSQEKIYYDKNDLQTEDISVAEYYRVKEDFDITQSRYIFTDFYLTGDIKAKGGFSDSEYKIKTGEFVYFYKNGNKECLEQYNNLGLLDGKFISWYENKNTKSEYYYENNRRVGERKDWYLEGEAKYIGRYIDTPKKDYVQDNTIFKYVSYWNKNKEQTVTNGKGYIFYDVNQKKYKGKIVEGLKDSIWHGFNEEYKLLYEDKYEKGIFIEGICYDSLANFYEYKSIKTSPEPKKGYERFYKYLNRKLKFPKEAKKYEVANRLIIDFTVNIDGSVKINSISTQNKDYYGFIDMVQTVFDNYDSEWIPGKYRGKIIPMRINLPITFSIE
ncbi:MAG: hypothetical protein H6604_09630 [Flavobacteriales bacterium]|nr:hypothetical protein [Flavobacteriales bacterium]